MATVAERKEYPISMRLPEADVAIASVMCGCPLRVKVDELRWVERTGAVMCPASDAAGLAAGPDELRGASAGSM
ncbi:hypothetical protein ACIDI_11c00150 [Acidiphilium sp. JA12-A1]|nr:hypothetical protein ACIDI_11c00150 [Acidiphilium sp. JA12-A1]